MKYIVIGQHHNANYGFYLLVLIDIGTKIIFMKFDSSCYIKGLNNVPHMLMSSNKASIQNYTESKTLSPS